MANQSLLHEITREAPKWVIDRIEDETWAVLENSDTHEIISLPIGNLPKDAKPGTTLIRQDGKWYINEADATARAAKIAEKFARIK
ncbi:MAG: DUF3006 domain-containing protein, partial [Defluviitaleaceae bacterium]|nr:DUF3006 domain-containing protein [Defluviitaleaceae bacterium]